MRIEGRRIYFDNLRDSETGEVLYRDIDPNEDMDLILKGLAKVKRHAIEVAESFNKMFKE